MAHVVYPYISEAHMYKIIKKFPTFALLTIIALLVAACIKVVDIYYESGLVGASCFAIFCIIFFRCLASLVDNSKAKFELEGAR